MITDDSVMPAANSITPACNRVSTPVPGDTGSIALMPSTGYTAES
jgi:hypothetical protein